MLENLNVCGGVFTFNLLVMRIRSRVIMKPRAVMYISFPFTVHLILLTHFNFPP